MARIRLLCTLIFLLGFPSVLCAAPMAITYHAPEAKSVAVRGSFDPYWQKLHPLKKDATGRWSVVFDLAPGRYEFQFLVDGVWRHDPRLPSVEDSFGGRNNVLLVFH